MYLYWKGTDLQAVILFKNPYTTVLCQKCCCDELLKKMFCNNQDDWDLLRGVVPKKKQNNRQHVCAARRGVSL